MDVRLALLLGALGMGLVARQPLTVVRAFLLAFADPKYIVPICSAMGFAYVLRHTECDKHLVHLLADPLRRVRTLMIPGAVCVGFLVNIPVISQTSTAVTIGPVLVPLMMAAEISPVTAGSALLLGSSVGGELLNPGAPEYGTVVKETEKHVPRAVPRAECVRHSLRPNLVQLFVATLIFWMLSARAEARYRERASSKPDTEEVDVPVFKVNLLKAAIPLVPLALLFLTAPPLRLLPMPQDWLVDAKEVADLGATAAQRKASDLFDVRLIAVAMLIGAILAALTTLGTRSGRRVALSSARAFFDGAGYAFAEIVGIIAAATCFAEGIKLIGIGDIIGHFTTAVPNLLHPAAGFLTMAFAFVSGSGMAATQGLFGFFVDPSLAQQIDPVHTGAVVSLGAAAGRTLSPVAAVTLMSARLTDTTPGELVKRVAVPLLVGVAAMVIVAALLAH